MRFDAESDLGGSGHGEGSAFSVVETSDVVEEYEEEDQARG